MPENPLLPNRKLRELHALMARVRALGNRGDARVEAVLAATLMHVEPGDFMSLPPVSAAATLATERTASKTRKKSAAKPGAALPAGQRLATVAGVAQGLKLAGDRVAVAYADAGWTSARRESGWAEALAYAQGGGLPLILVCTDATGGARVASPRTLSWRAMSQLGRKLQLPIFPVDGEDAVAVYRVMQESMLHARVGGGPAVIWAVLGPPSARISRGNLPVARLEAYLAARKISLGR